MKQLKTMFYIFTYCFKHAKLTVICKILFEILLGIIPSVIIIIETNLIDSVLNLFNNTAAFKLSIEIMIYLILLMLIEWTLRSISQFLSVILLGKIKAILPIELLRKKEKISYATYEDKGINDLTKRVSTNAEEKMTDSFNHIILFSSEVISIIAISIIIINYVSLLASIIFICTIPLFYIALKIGEKKHTLEKEQTFLARKKDDLSRLLLDREYVDERTLFAYSNSVNQEFHNIAKEVRIVSKKRKLFWFIQMKSSSCIIAFITLLLTFTLLNQLKLGAITFGIFCSLFNALNKLINKLSWEIAEVLDKLAQDCHYIDELLKFLHLPEKGNMTKDDIDIDMDSNIMIEFKNVSFKYPNNEKYVLKDISFKILKDNHYAIIGANGSGKSTLIKLLLGFYENYEGSIMLFGHEIKTLPSTSVYQLLSVVFQDFARYNLTIEENLLLGTKFDKLCDLNECNYKNIYHSLKLQSFIDSLEKKEKTALGKIYNENIDLSVGQWQRFAIARTVIKNSPVIILDEPTAALDPLIEKEIFSNFTDLIKSRTSIIISHRLGSIKNSSCIFLIDDGKLIDTGTHEYLYNNCRLYTKMYNKQKGWYIYE